MFRSSCVWQGPLFGAGILTFLIFWRKRLVALSRYFFGTRECAPLNSQYPWAAKVQFPRRNSEDTSDWLSMTRWNWISRAASVLRPKSGLVPLLELYLHYIFIIYIFVFAGGSGSSFHFGSRHAITYGRYLFIYIKYSIYLNINLLLFTPIDGSSSTQRASPSVLQWINSSTCLITSKLCIVYCCRLFHLVVLKKFPSWEIIDQSWMHEVNRCVAIISDNRSWTIPSGTSIRFNKCTHVFVIAPSNTPCASGALTPFSSLAHRLSKWSLAKSEDLAF